MSVAHNDQDSCGQENHNHDHDDHDHDHDDHSHGHDNHAGAPEHELNLFKHIDRDNVIGFNACGDPRDVIKPWADRLNDNLLKSDAISDAEDELSVDRCSELILHVPFTGSVKLRSILLRCGPGDQTPSEVRLYANEPHMDFDVVHADGKDAVQVLSPIVQTKDIVTYDVRTPKFSNVSTISLFFRGDSDSVQIYYVGFLGTWTEIKKRKGGITYETQANWIDHKIPGAVKPNYPIN